jgi:hypothetical protein
MAGIFSAMSGRLATMAGIFSAMSGRRARLTGIVGSAVRLRIFFHGHYPFPFLRSRRRLHGVRFQGGGGGGGLISR